MTDDAPKMNRTEGFGFHIVHNVVVIKMYSYFEGADKKVKRMRRWQMCQFCGHFGWQENS